MYGMFKCFEFMQINHFSYIRMGQALPFLFSYFLVIYFRQAQELANRNSVQVENLAVSIF